MIPQFFIVINITMKKGNSFLNLLLKNSCKAVFDRPSYKFSGKLGGKQRLESHIRSILAFFVREIDGLSNTELSVFLGRDSSTLCKLASRLERKCLESPSLATEINELRGWIFFDRDLQIP